MKRLSVLSIIALIGLPCFAQNLHIGLAGGLSNYNGDLIDRYYVRKQTNAFIGATVHLEIYDQFLLRGAFNFARVNGDDRYNSDSFTKQRNLRFESVVAELSVVGEFFIFNLYEKRYSPYLFAGLAVFYFNPYAHDTSGNKLYLKPLSTEGQGIYPDKKHYKKIQPAIPAGIGIKFAITDNIRIGIEAGIRKTFTDYLDDVSTSYPDVNDLFTARGQIAVNYSYRGDELPGGDPAFPIKDTQRGGSKYKDSYYFTGLNITMRMGGNNSGLFKGKKNRMGCPTVPI